MTKRRPAQQIVHVGTSRRGSSLDLIVRMHVQTENGRWEGCGPLMHLSLPAAWTLIDAVMEVREIAEMKRADEIVRVFHQEAEDQGLW